MDGILVDSESLHWHSVLLTLQQYLGDTAPVLEMRVGWGDYELWEELIDTYALPGTPANLTHQRGIIALNLLQQNPPPMLSGALEAIRLWRRGSPQLRLGVVSASPRDQMEQSLLGYVDQDQHILFDAIFSGIDDAPQNKPSPQPYLKAMQYFGVSPQECWIVEDSTTGITSGLATGAKVFAVGAHFADPKVVALCEGTVSIYWNFTGGGRVSLNRY